MTWLKQCLDSCRNYDVIVVDNASTDKTLEFISVNYPDVIKLPQKENLGFGKANNIGLSYALKHFSADYMFLLNQDAYLVDSVIEDLIETHKNNSDYGILSPIHITGDKKRLDQKFEKYLKVNNKIESCIENVLKNELKTIYDVPFVNAAGWLLSKECLMNVGGFDPLFFLYGEDDNLCQRVLYHGYKIGAVSGTYMIHDRDLRRVEPMSYSSKNYENIQSNIYKVEYANVNNPNALQDFHSKIKYLKRQCIKSLLLLKMNGFKISYLKYQLLINIKKDIEMSYELNKTKAQHYLSI